MDLPVLRFPNLRFLSKRERRVMELVAEGKTNKQIGEALAIAAPTVKDHRRNLMAKLGLRHGAEVMLLAFLSGMVQLDSFQPAAPVGDKGYRLSRRQREILKLICGGLFVREISKQLGLSPNTVADHCRTLRKKLGAHSRAQLALHGFRLGLDKGAVRMRRRFLGSTKGRTVTGADA